MRYTTKSLSAGAALVTSLVVALGATAAVAQSVTLSFATNTAPNNMRGAAESIFLEELTKASGGEINVIPYWGGSLMAGSEILGGVRDGVADMGFININYYPNQLLINSAANLFPLGPSTYEGITWAFDGLYESIPELNAEFTDLGQRIVYKYGVTPYAGVFKTPVASLEDFKGLRVRAASRWYLNLLQGAGATPVSMPWGDVYQGLQTGAIDGVFTNIDGIHRASLDEAAQNVFFMPELWLGMPFIISMNEAKFQSLSAEQQEAFTVAEAASRARFKDVWDSEIANILKAQEEAGYTIVKGSASDVEGFTTLMEVETNQKTWAEEASAAGIENPQAILDGYDAVITEALKR